MTFCSGTRDFLRIDPADLADPLTFHFIYEVLSGVLVVFKMTALKIIKELKGFVLNWISSAITVYIVNYNPRLQTYQHAIGVIVLFLCVCLIIG